MNSCVSCGIRQAPRAAHGMRHTAVHFGRDRKQSPRVDEKQAYTKHDNKPTSKLKNQLTSARVDLFPLFW